MKTDHVAEHNGELCFRFDRIVIFYDATHGPLCQLQWKGEVVRHIKLDPQCIFPGEITIDDITAYAPVLKWAA